MNFDWSHFHPLDHNAFNPICARYYGGFKIHARYWIEYQFDPLWPWHKLRCRWGKHDPVPFWRGTTPEFDETFSILTPPAGYICQWCNHEELA